MTQQQRQPLQYFQGSIGQQEDKNTSAESGSKPYKRLELLGADGNGSLWVSAYPKESKMMLAQPQALWNVGYASWTAPNGTVIHTAKAVSMIGNAQQPPVQQQPVQQPPVAEVAPQVIQEIDKVLPIVGNMQGLPSDGWANSLDARSRSIIRQVAFIHMENKDSKSLDQINELVGIYEQIILGLYVEEPIDPSAEDYTQQEF